MDARRYSRQIETVMGVFAPVAMFFERSEAQRREAGAERCDFVAGDPQEMPPQEYVEALRRHAVPEHPSWFAYTMSTSEARDVVAASLRDRLGLPFRPEDVTLTNAAIAGIAVVARTVADPGDEVIIISPPHFLYEPLILAAGASAVRVACRPDDFDLDVDAVAGAITDRTRAVIVNTPHNPTGRIYPRATLERLGEALTEASRRNGRPIYLLSDEAYHRIVFDDREFVSPAAAYPDTILLYSYGKQLLAPGQRIGFIALAPDMERREELMYALAAAQTVTGWAFPNTLLQHAIADLDPMSVDVKRLQRRRDVMVDGLRELGYELHVPEATFYLLPRSPIPDDLAFTERLAEENVFVMPGSLLEVPGHFRISLTASDEMIERAWPGFEAAIRATRAGG